MTNVISPILDINTLQLYTYILFQNVKWKLKSIVVSRNPKNPLLNTVKYIIYYIY